MRARRAAGDRTRSWKRLERGGQRARGVYLIFPVHGGMTAIAGVVCSVANVVVQRARRRTSTDRSTHISFSVSPLFLSGELRLSHFAVFESESDVNLVQNLKCFTSKQVDLTPLGQFVVPGVDGSSRIGNIEGISLSVSLTFVG
jgi:hypothetical protein